jgi:hypothetical protein
MPLTININNTTAKAFWAFAVFYCMGGLLFSQSQIQTFSKRVEVGLGSNCRIIVEEDLFYKLYGSTLFGNGEPSNRVKIDLDKAGEQHNLEYCSDSNFSQYFGLYSSFITLGNRHVMCGAGFTRDDLRVKGMIYISNSENYNCDTLEIFVGNEFGSLFSILFNNDFLYILGQINRDGNNPQFWFIKSDTLGNIIWEKDYGGEYSEWGQYLKILNDGSFLLTGVTRSYGVKSPPNAENTLNIWLIRTDSIGNVLWEQTFGDVGNEEPAGIFQSQDGNIVLGGSYSDTLMGNIVPGWSQYYLVKMDITGQVLWEKRLGGRTETERKLTCIREMPNGDIVASGWFYNYNLTNSDENLYITEIILFDKDGNIKWQRQHALLRGLNSRNFIESIIPTQDGGFIGVGTVIPFGADTGNQDIWVLKLNEYGCLHADCSDQKMVLADTIEETGYFTQRDDDFVLFPNPASQTVNIHSKEMLNGHVRVYDVRGAMVFEQKLHKTQRIYLDVSHYAKGLYFVHIHDKEQVKALRFLRE